MYLLWWLVLANILVVRATVHLPKGGQHTLSCIYGDWFWCRWEHNGERCESAPDSIGTPQCNSFGGGLWLDEGGCDLLLSNITEEHVGTWNATLLLNQLGQDKLVLNCEEEISIFDPASISISRLPYSLEVDKAHAVQCTTSSVNPNPTMLAIVQSRDQTRYLEEALVGSDHQLIKVFQYIPELAEGGPVEISCVAQQSIDGEVVFTDRISSVSQVVFPPQPTAIQETVLEENSTMQISFRVSCYPLPDLKSLAWHFVSSNASQSFQVVGGSLDDDYQIIMTPVSLSVLNITLVIRSVGLEGFYYHQYFRVENSFGAQDYAISFTQPGMAPDEETQMNLLSWVLLGVFLACLALLLVALSCIFRSKTGCINKYCCCCTNKQNKVVEIATVREKIPLQSISEEKIEVTSEEDSRPSRRIKRETRHSKSRSPSPVLRSSRRSEKRSTMTVPVQKISITSRESTYPVV